MEISPPLTAERKRHTAPPSTTNQTKRSKVHTSPVVVEVIDDKPAQEPSPGRDNKLFQKQSPHNTEDDVLDEDEIRKKVCECYSYDPYAVTCFVS